MLAITLLLVALLLPVFSRARNGAQTTVCLNNLHQIGLGLQLYTENYNGRYPAYSGQPVNCTWVDATIPYTKSSNVFVCPSAPDETYEAGCGIQRDVNGAARTFNGGYALDVPDLANSISITRVRVPDQFILVVDATSTTNQVVAVGSASTPRLSSETLKQLSVVFRHNERANVVFADGHSKTLPLEVIGDSAHWHLSGGS